ncbi:hypothetical protein FHEFKHOI_01260 [Candidatus Methanoperedenaceae archaeon GB50]|nr:hypothetical protein AIOGIFDO_01250 [Candidatus Methanoperedenaceae archaeon GB37]CAD7772634.1 hypothetical protein FHEFKHOI_01260 [Candidatus Methanoperedenaceae archaeon GB50]
MFLAKDKNINISHITKVIKKMGNPISAIWLPIFSLTVLKNVPPSQAMKLTAVKNANKLFALKLIPDIISDYF